MRPSYKPKFRGFTLVELLVVIAIISILLTILTPALQKARLQAKGALCMSNVKQWGQITYYYAEDNEGRLFQSVAGGGIGGVEAYWITSTLPYYQDKEIRLCPATRVRSENMNRSYGDTLTAWGPFASSTGEWWSDFDSGSYGINEWCASPPGQTYWGFPTANAWRKIDVKGGDNVPLFLDCAYVDGYPMHTDQPPQFPDEQNGWGYNAMRLFCMDRHNGGINGVFLDLSTRKIGLKELWELKWHREFATSNQWTKPDALWPVWMADL